ncbi:MAG: hypothetical protein IJQ87_00800 [Clostridia bacterium]|nr:hypothetical protein [Clostridia bacterium]
MNKKSLNFICVLTAMLAFALLSFTTYSGVGTKDAYASDFNAGTSSEIVMEASTLRVLSENNAHEKSIWQARLKFLPRLS